MSAETDRLQDGARRHRAKGAPSEETRSLLSRYHAAMRDDLGAILAELEPKPPEAGLGLVDTTPVRKPAKDRAPLWDLAIKLGRELGTEIEPTPTTQDAGPAKPRARRRRPEW